MATSICLLAWALALGQADAGLAPQLVPGLELVYAGSYLEESLGPNVQYQRQYRLETHALVLGAGARHWDLAVLTSLALHDPLQAAPRPGREPPASVRLELAQVDTQGRVRGAGGQILALDVEGPPTVEVGFVAEVPPGPVRRDETWEVAEPGHPPRTWQLVGSEVVSGITCLKLVARQQSDDWDRPRADRAPWRRQDTLWLSPQLLVAQRVERVIERRDPSRQQPTHRATVRYELESRLRYPGELFNVRRQEVLKARQFQDETGAWLKQPGLHRAQLEHALRRLNQHLDVHPATPYRKALVQLKAGLEAAVRGEVPVQAVAEEAPALPKPVELGQRVPDFVVSSLTDKEPARLDRYLGRPVLVVFYNPQTTTGVQVLRFAKNLAEAQRDRVAILAMAVTNAPEVARKQHADLRLPFPVLDGQGMRLTFGVEATPRLVVLDGDGVVRAATTGWGYQTPTEMTDALKRCQER